MHIVVKGIIAFFALCLVFLGLIFVIAGGAENIAIGAVMVLVGLGLFGFLYHQGRVEASQPRVVHQDVHVTMGGSGELGERRLNCPSCGAPVGQEHVSLMSGGMVIECPYCDTTSALEEEPKW